METLVTPSTKHKGALRGTAHVVKKVAKDPATRQSAQKVGDGTKVVAKAGHGVAKEIARNEGVKKASRHYGRSVVEAAGLVRYDATTGKHVPDVKGIKKVVSRSESPLKYAIIAGADHIPTVTEAVINAAPDAIKKFRRANPGAFREAAKASKEVAKGAVTLPVYAGIAATRGVMEVRASNRALEEDAAKYRAAQEEQPTQAPNLDITVHTADGPTVISIRQPQTSPDMAPGPVGSQPIQTPDLAVAHQKPDAPVAPPHALVG